MHGTKASLNTYACENDPSPLVYEKEVILARRTLYGPKLASLRAFQREAGAVLSNFGRGHRKFPCCGSAPEGLARRLAGGGRAEEAGGGGTGRAALAGARGCVSGERAPDLS